MPARMPAGIEDPEPQLGVAGVGITARGWGSGGSQGPRYWPETWPRASRRRPSGGRAGGNRPARGLTMLGATRGPGARHGVRAGGARLPVLPPRHGSAVCGATVEIIVIMVMRR